MAYWGGLLREFDEMLYAANQAGLSYFEREAGYTRSGYHGRRVDGQESGHFDEARLVFAQFLQHTSREDDPHLHVHNIIATVARTIMDEKWRTPDSYGYNEVFMAVSAVVSLTWRRRCGAGSACGSSRAAVSALTVSARTPQHAGAISAARSRALPAQTSSVFRRAGRA
jgi:TrwC relaxase